MSNTSAIQVLFQTISKELDVKSYNSIKEINDEDDVLAILKTTTVHYNIEDGSSDRSITLWMVDKNESFVHQVLTSNNWKFSIQGHTPGGIGLQYSKFFIAIFIDATGKKINDEIFECSIDGFISCYKRFLKLSEFQEYKVARLAIEKENLLADNTDLRKQILDLKSKIEILEDKILYSK